MTPLLTDAEVVPFCVRHIVSPSHNESWRAIPGTPSHEVSDEGRVRSVERVVYRGRGTTRVERARLMALYRRRDGRVQCNLQRNGKVWSPFVHALVAAAWIGPRPAGMEVCHRDGDASNNQATNLYYGTKLQNEADKARHGTVPLGERNGRRRLTLESARQIANDSRSQRSIAEAFGVSQSAVSDIKRGRRWSAAMKAADAALAADGGGRG
jgi:hypothetical protein